MRKQCVPGVPPFFTCAGDEATVNPFFSAFVILPLIVFLPILSLVPHSGMSKWHIIWSMFIICVGGIAFAFRIMMMFFRKC